jgi:threonylcarbamoyladenosine tRNA methylthiotransferase MtaB
MMPYKIFWCKVNKYFLNQRLDYFSKNWNDLSDTLLIASCVVTDRAKNKRVREVKHAIQQWLKVAITWCGSFSRWNMATDSEFYSIYPELKQYSNKITLLPESPSKNWFEYKIWWKSSVYTKHFLIVQNGCDNHCSFCLTVAKRWPHISRPLDEIIEEIHQIESQWWKEIVITWINLAARWCSNSTKPEETKFPYLLREILRQTSIPRIRISSMWPEYANDEFFEVVSDERILPHFHYSIQSFSNNVLQNMWRHYSSEELKTVLKKTRNLKKKNLISIWADIIVWFPWEAEEDFLDTYNWIEEFWITKLHAFPFSDHTQRERIPASFLPDQVKQWVKKEMEVRLISKWDEIREKFIAQNKWTSHKVLIEERRNWKRKWWTENYIQVEVEWDYNRGEIIDYIL